LVDQLTTDQLTEKSILRSKMFPNQIKKIAAVSKITVAIVYVLVCFGTVHAEQTVLGIHSSEAGAARAFRTVVGNTWGGFSGDSIYFLQSAGGALMATMNATGVTSTTGLFSCMQGPATAGGKFRMSNACSTFVFKLVTTSASKITLNLVRAADQPVAVNNWVTSVRVSPDMVNWTEAAFVTDTAAVRGVAQTAADGCYIITVSNLSIPVGNYIEVRTNSSQIFVEAVVTPYVECTEELIAEVYPRNGDTIPETGVIEITFNKVVAYSFCQGSVKINEFDMSAFVELDDLRRVLTIPYDVSDWNGKDTLFIEISNDAIFDNLDNRSPLSLFFVRINTNPSTSTISIENLNAIKNILIHPNPVFDVLNIEAEGLRQIEIIDMLGHTIIRRMQSSDKEQVDVRHLRKGLYFIRLTMADNRVAIERFVKK